MPARGRERKTGAACGRRTAFFFGMRREGEREKKTAERGRASQRGSQRKASLGRGRTVQVLPETHPGALESELRAGSE